MKTLYFLYPELNLVNAGVANSFQNNMVTKCFTNLSADIHKEKNKISINTKDTMKSEQKAANIEGLLILVG